jgi:hypothetical protein
MQHHALKLNPQQVWLAEPDFVWPQRIKGMTTAAFAAYDLSLAGDANSEVEHLAPMHIRRWLQTALPS